MSVRGRTKAGETGRDARDGADLEVDDRLADGERAHEGTGLVTCVLAQVRDGDEAGVVEEELQELGEAERAGDHGKGGARGRRLADAASRPRRRLVIAQ